MAIEGYPDYVNGEDNIVYSLVRKIGDGGQGWVFATSDGKRAVKLTKQNNKDADNPMEKSRLKKIAALPLWNLAISKPLVPIVPKEGFEGYVMDLLTGMVPIAYLMSPVEQLFGEDLVAWYVKETGGLKKRLKVLAFAAETIAALHSLGLVFADPSPANILVSADPDEFHTWLIDPDNIGLAKKDKRITEARGTPTVKSVGTLGFCAPEVERGEKEVCSLSDAFGFAAIVCNTLTLNHPYCGDLVVKAAAEEETEAFKGKYPWIGDQKDTSNASTSAMALSLVMTKRLFELSDKTFSNGAKRENRPGVREWAEALHAAADVVIECKHCNATYFPTREGKLRETCPYCGGDRTKFALMKLARWMPEWTEKAFEENHPGTIVDIKIDIGNACITDTPFAITRRTAFGISGFDSQDAEQTVLSVKADSKKLNIDPIGKNQFFLSIKSNEPEALISACEIEWSEGPIVLHFGPLDKKHRTASFNYY
jgi:eukaryotic-like serine/threonine-protein kinase